MKEKQLEITERVGTCAYFSEQLKDKWAREEELRKKEAEANDLPRVKLSTTKGDMVIELYENEAPDTVGNFVSLVEKKYYDGLTFHRVLPHFMAQGGDPKGDGSGGPGYHIYCECYEDDARDHFAGTLSMAKTQQKNTGGSQFFITFQATPHLNGQHTVFGRVIEGLDVLPKLNRHDPESLSGPPADRILKAEVIRKRDHVYQPHKAP
ncbi:peptidylprolyl isomerase [bacterium]|nr:peptidylprolyl isomerase [bacterium]